MLCFAVSLDALPRSGLYPASAYALSSDMPLARFCAKTSQRVFFRGPLSLITSPANQTLALPSLSSNWHRLVHGLDARFVGFRPGLDVGHRGGIEETALLADLMQQHPAGAAERAG